jgi:hypothetical protein
MKRKIPKAFCLILVSVIALSFMAINPVKADTLTSGSYASYCRQESTYTWFNRISTTDVANGDDVGVWYNLPWSFPYYGEAKSRVYICSNGFLIFDPTGATTDYTNTASEFRSQWMIAPFWDDLRTDVSGGYVSTPGVYVDYVANCIIITWETTRIGAPADSIKFQIVLAPSGIIRASIASATNFANFSPTSGISKGTTIDFIDMSSSTQKTWIFWYDLGDVFAYDRAGTLPSYKCITPSGWIDYGECHLGPSNARDYVPDWFQWTYDEDSWNVDFKWYENLYADAQNWYGKDLCYTMEFNIPRSHMSAPLVGFWSNLPSVELNEANDESWGGIDTWEFDAHTFWPENIQANTVYSVYVTATMLDGNTLVNSVGEESELYDDYWRGLFEPNGIQLDWFKEHLGQFWANNGVVRFGCGPPKILIDQSTFPGGAITALTPNGTSKMEIRSLPSVRTYEDLVNYVSSRINVTNGVVASSKADQLIPVTVTFNEPINPQTYIDLVKKMGVDPISYRATFTDGYATVGASKQMPYNEEFTADLRNQRNLDIVGITGFTGSIPAKNIDVLQSDSHVLLVDPWKDVKTAQLEHKYTTQGYSVEIAPTIDLWPQYNKLRANQ